MLNHTSTSGSGLPPVALAPMPPTPPPTPFDWLPAGFSFLRRNLLLIGLCGTAGLGLGLAYVLTAPQKYTAEATLQALRLAQAGAEAAHAERSQALQREAARLAAEHAASTNQLKAQLAAQVETHRADLTAAVERAVQAERRAAADMDRERQARARAEQIARETRQQAELTLADERARAQAERVAQVQSYSRLEAQAQVLRDRVGQMEADMRRVRLRDRSDKSRAVASPLARLRERGRG